MQFVVLIYRLLIIFINTYDINAAYLHDTTGQSIAAQRSNI